MRLSREALESVARARAEGRVTEGGVAPPVPAAEVAGMGEAEFTRLVIAMAREAGWLCAHFRPAQTKSGHWMTAVQGDGAGFPDLVLVRGRVVYAELKSAKGRLRPDQLLWRDCLWAAGAEWYCWRPGDIEEIRSVLR